jgi:hypothetical protein
VTRAIFAVWLLLSLGCDGGGEVKSKREWSILQVAESTHRDSPTSEKRLLRYYHEEYRAVGVLTDDARGRVWILLNARHDPMIKEIPANLPYHLSSSELDQVLADGDVSVIVAAHLRSKVR